MVVRKQRADQKHKELRWCQRLWLEIMAEEPDTNIWEFVPWAVKEGYLTDIWLFVHWAHNIQCLAHMPKPLGSCAK